MKQVIIIGAGVGGLTTAAVLARTGLAVTVLEAQAYPGGCAGTFFHQGYRFDAGATLAGGFYPGGPMDLVAQATGSPLPFLEGAHVVQPADPVMVVHLPGGVRVVRRAGAVRWDDYREAFGSAALAFFRWQERNADALWNLAVRLPPWPVQSLSDAASALSKSFPWFLNRDVATCFPALVRDAFCPVAAHLRGSPDLLRLFVDAQLLISAQATSESTNALYGAAALDLPRRGVVHPLGGMGAIAQKLAESVQQYGGHVLYHHTARRIRCDHNRPVAVETQRGDSFPADVVIANLTPMDLVALLEDNLPEVKRKLPSVPDGWGAFVVYVGLDGSVVPADYPLHHQIILRRPLGEGNSVFASLSPAWDPSRAPSGQRALTLSTHTALDGWWELYAHDRQAYEAHKTEYSQKLLAAANVALPGLRDAIWLTLSGTPITYQRFTRRRRGWVGGFPQTSLVRFAAVRLHPNLWLVGDSIFPGQSTAAVALGGLRVAKQVLRLPG